MYHLQDFHVSPSPLENLVLVFGLSLTLSLILTLQLTLMSQSSRSMASLSSMNNISALYDNLSSRGQPATTSPSTSPFASQQTMHRTNTCSLSELLELEEMKGRGFRSAPLQMNKLPSNVCVHEPRCAEHLIGTIPLWGGVG
jgi:hypothetical protein